MNRTIDATDPNFEWITDGRGRRVRVLRDGGRTHVRFRDAIAARAVSIHDGRQALSDRDRQLAGCRPGYRFVGDRTGQRERLRDAAYAEAEAALVNAWKRPWLGLGRWRDDDNGVGSYGFRGQQENDRCTVSGRDGRLRRIDGQLQCVPLDDGDDDPWQDRPEKATSDDSSAFALNMTHDATERAYAAYAAELQQRWRKG
jgi:hypothetical protein